MKKYVKTKTRPVAKGFPRLLLTGILLAVAFLTTGVLVGLSRQKVSAKDPRSSEKSSPVTSNDKRYITRYVGSQMVQIDSQTGQVKPLTPEEARKLADGLKALANQSTEGLKQVKHSDGSVSIDLQDRFQNVMLARKEPEGTVSQSCVDNPQAGAAFFHIDPKLVGAQAKAGTVSTSKPQPNK